MANNSYSIDAEAPSGVLKLSIGYDPGYRAQSRTVESEAGWVVTGIRLVGYEVWEKEGKEENRGTWHHVEAMVGLSIVQHWWVGHLERYAYQHGRDAHVPTYIAIPPRQNFNILTTRAAVPMEVELAWRRSTEAEREFRESRNGEDWFGRVMPMPEKATVAWVIEFRSGSFFRHGQEKVGCPISDAYRFRSKEEAEFFMSNNEWILLNGGMPRKLGERAE